jgi:hypothetical protein
MLRKRALNNALARHVPGGRLAARGALMGRLEVRRGFPRRAIYEARTRASRDARVTGLVGWTVLEMPGVRSIDNTPGRHGSWMPYFLPFERTLSCRRGEPLALSLEAVNGPGMLDLLWRWRVAGRAGLREGSSVAALPGVPSLLTRGSPDWVARPSRFARALADVCRAVDGRTPAGEIARRVHRAHRSLFANGNAALDFVLAALRNDSLSTSSPS